MNATDELRTLTQALKSTPEVLYAILVGSRADGTSHEHSDWDIAIRWQPTLDVMHKLERHESLRHQLAQTLKLADDAIDLIDIDQTGLTMREVISNLGQPLHIADELGWSKFQTTTWRQLEDFYWERSHAA